VGAVPAHLKPFLGLSGFHEPMTFPKPIAHSHEELIYFEPSQRGNGIPLGVILFMETAYAKLRRNLFA
jgi:hypothetical protein